MRKKRLFFFLSFLAASLSISTALSEWVIADQKVDDTYAYVDNQPPGGIVENYIKDQTKPYAKFTKLEQAIAEANTHVGTQITTVVKVGSIIEMNNVNISINPNVHVILPFADKEYYTAEQFATNTYADNSLSNVSINRKVLVKLNNSKITVEQNATLSIGGQTWTFGTVGAYAELNLDPDSSIEVSGTLNVFGYVKESDNNHGNLPANRDVLDNSRDSNRFIKVTGTGMVYTHLGLYDLKSGGTLYTINDLGILPVSVFKFPNIQTYALYEKDSRLKVNVKVDVAGNYEHPDAFILGKSGRETALFYINEGALSFEYCPTTVGITSNDTGSVTRAVVHGAVAVGYLSLSVGINITTQNKFLPISYTWQIFVNSGGTLTSTYKIKFLPGSLLKVAVDGTFNNNSEIIFYKSNSMSGAFGTGYPSGLADAQLIINGSLTVNANGKVGARIETENEDTSGSLNLNAMTTQANLTVKSNEGTNNFSIPIVSVGTFYEENGSYNEAQFKYGTSVVSTNRAWVGPKNDVLSLVVRIVQQYTINVGTYRVYTNTSDSGDGTEITSGETNTPERTFTLAVGEYVRIVTSRIAGQTFSGTETLFTSGNWYQVNEDLELIILPNEGVRVKINTEPDSGAGTTTYEISESSTENGDYDSLITITANGTYDLIKGWYFKIKFTGGTGRHEGELLPHTVTYDFVNFTTSYPPDFPPAPSESGPSGTQFTFDTARQANTHFTIYVALKEKEDDPGTCLLPDTKVLMADGSYKAVKDIELGDMVMMLNHETGNFEPSPVIINYHEEAAMFEIINLKFSNGDVIGVVGHHGFFNVRLNKYVYINRENYHEYIGDAFYAIEGTSFNRKDVILEEVEVFELYTEVYSPASFGSLNIITEKILSITGDISGIFNIFEYDPLTLQFDQEKMAADIEMYGLLDYELFADFVSYEIYVATNAQYFGVAIGKGMLTWEDIFNLASLYADIMIG